jgi:excisionase family DNA binding protein
MMEELPDKRFFRPDEVAELLRVHVRTVRRWIAKGKLEAKRTPGMRIRVSRKEVCRLTASK